MPMDSVSILSFTNGTIKVVVHDLFFLLLGTQITLDVQFVVMV